MGRKNQVLEKVFDRLNIKVDPDKIEQIDFMPTYEMAELIQERLKDQNTDINVTCGL